MVSASARDWTAKNPQQVKAYREAIDEAAAWGMANNAATKDIVGKWLKLTPEIMANTSIDQLLSKLTADDIKWWVDTLNEQKLLRTKIEPAKIVAQ
jgi:NitT/TauT family transport system substrate-binding protein